MWNNALHFYIKYSLYLSLKKTINISINIFVEFANLKYRWCGIAGNSFQRLKVEQQNRIKSKYQVIKSKRYNPLRERERERDIQWY